MSQLSLPTGGMPPRLRIALDASRHGRAVVLLDDDDRENEGDLIVAADRITVPMMATLIRECSGIVCLCMTDEHLQRRAVAAAVVRHHGRQRQALQVLVGHAQADDARALADQRGHHRHGDALGRDDEVTLVFAVVVVLQHHGAAVANGVQRDPEAWRHGVLGKGELRHGNVLAKCSLAERGWR